MTTAEPIYLDCNATTPIEPAVLEEMHRLWSAPLGNAGSRTHLHGARATKHVQTARERIAAVIAAEPAEVHFTSGATESNNLAILGLAAHAEHTARRHVVSTAIEHKAVLEPLSRLAERGFDITLVRPTTCGAVSPADIQAALRKDTVLVSVMQANNETGIRQPLDEIANALEEHDGYFHVDAAQVFGKDLEPLRNPRIDLLSVTAHKVYGPVGIGALISRRRNFRRVPLQPIVVGGGQENGLRSGTLPVPQVVGFGMAAMLAMRDHTVRHKRCQAVRSKALTAFASLPVRYHGDQTLTMPHVLSLSIEGVDAEALMVALKDLVAVSNGSACTSQSYEPSHVLEAMGLPDEDVHGTVRMSWSHLTPSVNWAQIVQRIQSLI